MAGRIGADIGIGAGVVADLFLAHLGEVHWKGDWQCAGPCHATDWQSSVSQFQLAPTNAFYTQSPDSKPKYPHGSSRASLLGPVSPSSADGRMDSNTASEPVWR